LSEVQTHPDSDGIAVVDYGFMACSYRSNAWDLKCWGAHGYVERQEFEGRFEYLGAAKGLVLTSEGLDYVACVTGTAGMLCKRSKTGAGKRLGSDQYSSTTGSSPAHAVSCYLDDGKVACSEKPFFDFKRDAFDGAVSFDAAYGTRAFIGCAAFANGKVKCDSSQKGSPLLNVPAAVRAS
jgi:hypothetical protein